MNLTDMTDKARVRTVGNFDLYTIGRIESGTLGTVHVTDGDDVRKPRCLVFLDDARVVQVWTDGLCTAADFELAEE